MVHGNIRFGSLYCLGVAGGGLFYVMHGATGTLSGCSGGLYGIFVSCSDAVIANHPPSKV